MKQIILLLMITAILAQSFGKLIIFSNYLVNKEFITLNYCENKSKPKAHCNGKCHLKKQFKEQEKQEGSTKNNVKEVQEVQLFSASPDDFLFCFTYTPFIPNWLYIERETNIAPFPVFHPPTS